MQVTERPDAKYYHKIILINSKTHPMRIHSELFKEVLMAIGYNHKVAAKITDKAFQHFFKDRVELAEVMIDKLEFSEYLNQVHLKNKLEVIKKLRSYFYAIIKLRMKQQGLIILIGGASGSGKSSLVSLLAGRLHLKEMSSDNIRHIMRNFISKSESPFIFSSTYDSYHLIKDETLSLEQRTIQAYLNQCTEVQRELKKVLEYYYKSGVWVIVEGVHITPDYIISCMKDFKTCFGCIVHVDDPEKYKNRFASRSSKNSIKPEDNKYIQSFDKIMMIQSHLVKEAEAKKIPRIHNTNLELSFSLIHMSFLKNFKIISRSEKLIDSDADTAEKFYEEFMRNKTDLNKMKTLREYVRLAKPAPTTGPYDSEVKRKHRSSIALDADEDGTLTLGRAKDLKPISHDNRKEMVILSHIAAPGVVKAITKYIRNQDFDSPERMHWVETNRRTIIFKTNDQHKTDEFVFDYVLDSGERISKVITDAQSDQVFFKDVQKKSTLKKTANEKSSRKIPGKREEELNNSFESDKRRNIKAEATMVDLANSEAPDPNEMDNSIDNFDSDRDSQGAEAYDQDQALDDEDAKEGNHKILN